MILQDSALKTQKYSRPREAAINEVRHRATWVKNQPVRIEVAEGDGHDAEEWVEDAASS